MNERTQSTNQTERLEAYRRAMDEAFRVASDPLTDQRTARMLERLDARIDAGLQRRRHLFNILKPCFAVASLIAFAFLGWAIYSRQQESLPERWAFENITDDVRKVSLPDGTRACLKRGATISYSKAEESRIVALRGEAYFDVAPDSLHPFVVMTDALDIKVLGTAFSVSSVPGNNQTDIILERGSVRLLSKGGMPLMRLTPNQKAVYDHSTGDLAVEQVYAAPAIQQEFSIISFDNALIEEIIPVIESNYGIKVKASGYDPTKQYNVSFLRSDRPGEVLALLEALTGGHFSSSNSL